MFVDAIHILFPTSNAMHGKFPAPICCRDSENVYTGCKMWIIFPRTSTKCQNSFYAYPLAKQSTAQWKEFFLQRFFQGVVAERWTLIYFFIKIVTKLKSKQKKQNVKTHSILIIWPVQSSERSFSFRDSLRGLLQRDVWHKAKATHPGLSSLPNHPYVILFSLYIWHLYMAYFTTLASA